MKLVTVSQIQKIEKEADAGGLSFGQMMENAGLGLAGIVADIFDEGNQPVVVGLVGPGNNGGDTLVAMTFLLNQGWRAHAYLLKRKKDDLVTRFTDAGGSLISAKDEFDELADMIESATVILDGVLGTGIKLPLKKDAADLLSEVNDILDSLEERPLVVAVDCPSGVDCDSGDAAEETIHADMTVTMAAVKQGLLKLPAFEYVGALDVVDIGLPADLKSWREVQTEVAEEAMIAAMLPERPLASHKGTFGTTLIAAGSASYAGAVLLAGEAAYRSGSGLVKLAVPAPLQSALAGQLPEATWVSLPQEKGSISSAAVDTFLKNMDQATAILFGPGMGLEDSTRSFIEDVLRGKRAGTKSTHSIGFIHNEGNAAETKQSSLPPLVVDADGLKLLGKIKDWHTLLPSTTILTPHPGEMSVLSGVSKEEIQENRESVALKFAKEWGHIIVLKGAFTLIASPDGRLTLIPVATPSLARAGTGDVLAGLIAGLRSQGMDAYEAAITGAWIHAQAGLYAADDLGTTASVLASDVLSSIPDVLSDLE